MQTLPTAPAPSSSPVPAGAGREEPGDAVDMVAVRAWARSRGYPIDESGSIPLTVVLTYRRLHPR